MATEYQPRRIPTLLNALGLGLPQVGENLRTERKNQDLQMQQGLLAQQQQQAALNSAGASMQLLENAGIQPRSKSESISGMANAYRLTQGGLDPQTAAASMAGRSAVQEKLPQQALAAQFTPQQTQAFITDQQNKFLAKMIGPSEVWQAYQQIEGMLSTGDALGTRAAMIKLAKILDPTSVVREGEVTTIEGGTGMGNWIMNEFNAAFNQGAPEQMVQAIRNTALKAAGPVLENAVRQRNEFAGALDYIYGADLPGAARIVTGSGLPWGEIENLLQGGQTAGVQTDPETGETYRVIPWDALQGQ